MSEKTTPTGAPRLEDLAQTHDFVGRHIGPDATDTAHMLEVVGADDLDDLVRRAVPAAIRTAVATPLPDGCTETEATRRLRERADRIEVLTSLIGMGYYDTITPAVIRRNVLENPGWYTAYTPYQPEISQGRLEALLNFQTLIMDLTAMEIATSSLLDEATAAAEAMALSHRVSRNDRSVFIVDSDCLPQTLAVVRTRAEPLGVEVRVVDVETEFDASDAFGVLLQYPGLSGEVRDLGSLVERVHEQGALVTVAADLLGLTVLTPPGEWDADIVVGSAQRFGVPLGFGGPHAGYMSTRDAYKRSLPGRLVGVSIDSSGRDALRLALQTREQHIRREKATSNICTAQVLLAVMASMYAVYHGPEGLRTIARRVNRLTTVLAEGLARGGVEVHTRRFFDTIVVEAPDGSAAVLAAARARGVNLRPVTENTVGISLDEKSTSDLVETLWSVFGVTASVAEIDAELGETLPSGQVRDSEFMTHPVFHRFHSETEMMRYLRKLSDRDIALDRAMIPLGSCTMKLNAATEMEPVSWPEFAGVHPFAPLDQVSGYLEMIHELEDMLLAVTGYDAVSLQPNAGSQGEFSGLMAIRGYHRSRGEGHRDVCLIPSSAHGTNAASAAMAGLRVVVVACDERGNVDVEDLAAKIEEHGPNLAALMITYPSTHGVFEEAVVELCEMVHRAGGQVYVDGANLNALVGVAPPGEWGGDVSHLNLHKTFCIPHGGGGPGVGPVAAKSHLAPFLPGHPVVPECGPPGGPTISAAPWGSAGILPISWVYITLMGALGLRRATQMAILNANYVARRLDPHYPVLYTGPGGLVAHECIVDLRPLKKIVSVDDVAKRLIDYGFHAPTMSFPVPGTLMIEPTESESLAEIDRFCDAMIAIRGEIARVESGEWPLDDNPLVNAPHTVEVLATREWAHPYSREEAAYPVPGLHTDKYWVPVGRIDNSYGDRHLVACACPPPGAYEEASGN